MRYVMKQKLFCWGDDFTIKDEHGNDVFFVDGKAFSLGDRLSFKDLAGAELAHIKQKVLSWRATYEIYRDDRLAATVRKRPFTFFKAKFDVGVPGPDDLTVEGDFLAHEYRFTRDGQPVATVSKQWFSWTDTYGVDIADGEDDVVLLAAAVAIDMMCHADKD